jgi:polyhydroxybutyrate depolymerase
MGMSNGAMMSHRAGCERSTKVAAIGAVTGLFPEALAATCAPARPVPAMMIDGVEDHATAALWKFFQRHALP